MTYHLIVISLLRFVCFSEAGFAPVPQQSACDKPNRNSLVEHFFNTIFTEFYNSPPVCVCVQMCAGQSTYCYPNGCFNSAKNTIAINHETGPKDITAPTVMQKNKNNFMLVKDERDFMADYLEKNYVNELKDTTSNHNPVQDLLPDVFKSKYTIVSKYKKTPTVGLGHNIHDKVKKDLAKSDGDWTKTRWPMSRQNKRSGPTLFSHIEKSKRNQNTYFTSIIRDNDVPEYSSKYFKRELMKADDDEKKMKTLYSLENLVNMTESKIFSLDKLIENLIKSGVSTNIDTTSITDNSNRDETKLQTKPEVTTTKMVTTVKMVPTKEVVSNETTKIISMNHTNENVEKNKYLEISKRNKTANLSAMIKHLANQIEIQNNTSMEIAKRAIKSFDTHWYDTELKHNDNYEEDLVNTTINDIEIKTTPLTTNNTKISTIESTITDFSTGMSDETTKSSILNPNQVTLPQEKSVTRKNRQKVVKKSGSSKLN